MATTIDLTKLTVQNFQEWADYCEQNHVFPWPIPETVYAQICRKLGIDPSIHFVQFTRNGEVTFTSGKPDEIKLLYHRVLETGMQPAKSLIKAVDEI